MNHTIKVCDEWVTRKEDSLLHDPSLMTGHAGVALYWLIKAKTSHSSDYLHKAHFSLVKALNHLSYSAAKMSFFEGPLGVFFVHNLWVELTGQKIVSAKVEKDFIFTYLDHFHHLKGNGYFDWLSGSGAWIVYSKDSRFQKAIGECSLKHILDSVCPHVFGTALETNSGRVLYGWGHGFASSVVFLTWWGKKNQSRLSLELAKELAHTLNQIILSQDFQPAKGDEDRSIERQHWCHGSLGIGYALKFIGEELSHNEWEKNGLKLIKKTFEHQQDPKGALCHGHESLYMYGKMFGIKSLTFKHHDIGEFSLDTPMLFSPLGMGMFYNSEADFWWSDFLLPTSLSENT